MKKTITILALCAMCAGAWAVPAYPGVIERVQPNGDTLHVYLRGDERMHWLTTEDGWLVQEDKKGWLKYVRKDRKGAQRLSLRKAHDAAKRSKCEKKWLVRKGYRL